MGKKLVFILRFSRLNEKILGGSLYLQIGALFIFTLIIIILGGVLILFLGHIVQMSEAVWWAFVRIVDPGNLINDNTLIPRVVGVIVGMLGWVIFGLMISIQATAIQSKLESLRRGTRGIRYRNHTVVLGWNPTIYALLDERAFTLSRDDVPIVIMSSIIADEMYKDIGRWCKQDTLFKVVCRTGDPESCKDQERMNIKYAKEVILMNNKSVSDPVSSDASVLKMFLSLEKLKKDDETSHKTNVVMELLSPLSKHLIEGICKNLKVHSHSKIQLHILLSCDIVGKLMAQCSIQQGMSKVYDELLSSIKCEKNDGSSSSEVYLIPYEQTGLNEPKAFNHIYMGFQKSVLIGYKKQCSDIPIINPCVTGNELLEIGDMLVFVADNDGNDNFIYEENNLSIDEIQLGNIEYNRAPENVLVLGEGHKTLSVIYELGSLLSDSSSITCMSALEERLKKERIKKDVRLSFIEGKNDILTYIQSYCQLKEYSIIIFANDMEDIGSNDCKQLMYLGSINAAYENSPKKPRIVMELLEKNNVELARKANADDVILGNEIMSNYMVQIAEQPERHKVFSELFTSEGSEIYIKSIERYWQPDNGISFRQASIAARKLNETAIGYGWEDEEGFKYVINPPLDKRISVNPNIQKLIVIARDF